MGEREDRFRVAIYVSPGFWDTHSIRTLLGRTVQRAGNKRAEYVVLGCGGRNTIYEWYKQAKAILKEGAQIRYMDQVPDWGELGKRVDPQYLLYFSSDCEGVEEKSKLISKQGIDYRFTFIGRGER